MKNYIFTITLILLVMSDVFGARITSDTLQVIKPGSSADKVLKLGATRQIRSNETSGKLQFSNDGSIWKAVGAGDGGSTGGVQELSNEGFEDGITSDWTSSAGDVSELSSTGCTLGTNCPLIGEKSLRFSPSAQNDYFESSLGAISEANYGRSCEARVFYIGGDENLTAQVINGDSEVLGEQVLKAHSVVGHESVFFQCPTKAEIVADNDKGDLKLKVYNATVTAAASSDFDDMYLGNLIGLVEMELPDIFTARISSLGTVNSENVDWIDSVTKGTAGKYTINFKSGIFTQTPSISLTPGNNDWTMNYDAINNVSVNVNAYKTNGTLTDVDFSVTASSQGVDAKQSVQVYKSVPKAAQNINIFTARVNTSGTVTGENANWIDGNCSKLGTGIYKCTYVAGVFNEQPAVAVKLTNGDAVRVQTGDGANQDEATFFTVEVKRTDTYVNDDIPFTAIAVKAGADFKTATVQPVIVGQVTNSYAEVGGLANTRIESCKVNNNGTATIDTSSALCGGWLQSVSRTGTGQISSTIISGTFSKTPVCTCSPMVSGSNNDCQVYTVSSASVVIESFLRSTGAAVDQPISLICVGAR